MKKPIALVLGLVVLGSAPVFAQTSVGDLTDGLTTFVEDATSSLPFASAAGLDWSDAYIGSIVGVPPHFGIGITAGATTIPGKTVEPLVSALGGELPFSDLPLPLVALNARIGGVLLPFDVGLKVGTVPGGLTVGDYNITYQNYGLDVRYAVFQGEPLLPAVSVGVGVDYFAAGVEATYGDDVSYSYDGETLTATAPKVTLDLSSLTFEAKAQVSKSLLILTPYAGLAVLYGTADAEASVNSDLTSSTGDLNDWKSLVPGLTSKGFGKSNSTSAFGVKVFGGTSVNLFVLRFDLQGLYNLTDGTYGATLGTRFQL